MASTATFASTARSPIVQISAANTNLDGTGTIVSGITGVAAGTRVEYVRIQHTGTSTAGFVNIFLSTDAGVTWRLMEQIPVQAYTPSSTVAAWHFDWFPPLGQAFTLADASTKLGFSTYNAETINVMSQAYDLT